MNTIIGALALLVAAPVAAQTAPAQAGHAQHQQPQGQEADHKHGQTGAHSGHMDCCKDGKHADCCAKAKDGTMACHGKHHGEAGHKGHGA